MNFITPLLFVFYLQVMPPPPPTTHGGGDLQAGYTNNILAAPGFWNSADLTTVLNGGKDFYLDGTYDRAIDYYELGDGGYSSVKKGIQSNYYLFLSQSEWEAFINYASLPLINDKSDACSLALEKGRGRGRRAYNNLCLPLPKELLFLSILSFLFIYYYHNRKEFSKLTLFKKSSE
jgi:hypothetical protein